MTKNPFINALAATTYIVVIVFVINFATKQVAGKSLFIPIAMLSLFTLSAAVMGYLFLFQSVQLYVDGKKKQAVALFLRTTAVFAVTTIILLAGLFSHILQ